MNVIIYLSVVCSFIGLSLFLFQIIRLIDKWLSLYEDRTKTIKGLDKIIYDLGIKILVNNKEEPKFDDDKTVVLDKLPPIPRDY